MRWRREAVNEGEEKLERQAAQNEGEEKGEFFPFSGGQPGAPLYEGGLNPYN